VTQTPVSFNECTLVAFLAPLNVPDFPALHRASSPEMKLTRLAPDLLLQAALSLEPTYALEYPPDVTAPGPDLLFGPNSLGVRADRRVYGAWEHFRDTAVRTLVEALPHFGGRPFTGFMLRYVDLFEAPSLNELARMLSVRWNTAHTAEHTRFALVVERTDQLDDVASTVQISYDVARTATNDAETTNITAVVSFDVRTDELSFHRTSEDLLTLNAWLEAAHALQKRLLWEALTPELRRGPAQACFDTDEINRFERADRERPR